MTTVDVDVRAPVKIDMNWIPWSSKSAYTPFRSTQSGVGDGETKVSNELDTTLLGPNSPYDMTIMWNGIMTQCDVKKLDACNDFNTGRDGRNVLRPIKLLHTTFLNSLNTFVNSELFTDDEKAKLKSVEDVSPDEVAVGTIRKLKEICVMLNLKKQTLRTKLPPPVPFTANGQTKDIPLDLYYVVCKQLGFDFPTELYSNIDTIRIILNMDHVYIDDPGRFMEDLNAVVAKLFADLIIILVDEEKGYLILSDASQLKFYRITRGCPRFQVTINKSGTFDG